MSYYIDDELNIVPVECGDAANDRKGELLRISVLRLNTNINLIRDFLTGGNGATRLNKPLPVSRGGTGASSAASAVKGLGLGVVDCNGFLRARMVHIKVYRDKITAGPYVPTDSSFVIMKLGTGNYRITGITSITQMVMPFDMVNKPLFIVEVDSHNTTTKETIISVYSVKWENGWVKDALIDIPINTSFDIEIG